MKAKSKRTSAYRRMSMLGFEMVKGGHNFYALLEFDVTDMRKELRQQRRQGTEASLFSLILKAIGRCLKEYPAFNSMINMRRHTTFDEVDIDIPIEVSKNEEIYNKQCIIRDIDKKTVEEIDAEIRHAKDETGEEQSYMASKFGQTLITSLPKSIVLFIFQLILKNHKLVKKHSGTVFVTSVSMFSNAPGFVIPYAGGPKAVSFAVGSVVKKPVVKRDEIQIREIVNLTAVFNHDLIDGAPAARFINRLRRYIEQDYQKLF
jgi:pyruvate/2-oxoglutarate dehydrogenase complex dihydrolipoamide acyltransferase (E2) component